MRVVITRPRKQSASLAKLLRSHGFEPVFFPTICIQHLKNPAPLDRALNRLAEFDWVVFTSANAVDAVWKRLAHTGLPFPDHLGVAAIGSKTAARLASRGVQPDFVPDEYIAEAILPGLGNLSGSRVFLPLAALAEDTLAQVIEAAGGSALRVTAYQTVPAEPDTAGLAALRGGVGAVTFTSGSTARNFATLIRTAGLDPFSLPGNPLIACIGPKTAAAARKAGFSVDRVAAEHTEEGLLKVLKNGVHT